MLVAGLVLIVATNAVVLGGAAYNRGGDPEATLRITEREGQFPYEWGFERENSGLSFSLEYRVLRALPTNRKANIYDLRGLGYGSPQWLDRRKLIELGFDLATPANDLSGERRYQKQLPKPVFVVLEMDGEAYRSSLKRMEKFAARESKPEVTRVLQEERDKNSRLFVVDAGLDLAALRGKYPDRRRFAIMHGKVALRDWGDGIGGFVEVIGTKLNVPVEFHGVIGKERRYEANLAFGRRLEPWLTTAATR